MYYSGDKIQVCGDCVLDVKSKGKTTKSNFYVADESRTPILGTKACEKLGLVKVYSMLTKSNYRMKNTAEQILIQDRLKKKSVTGWKT